MGNEKIHWAWLHLSDIHFGHGSMPYQADQENIISRIVSDVQKVTQSGVPQPEAILLTGDVAFSGGVIRKQKEYSDAEEFISNLQNSFRSPVPIFAVPGNHDVQRTPEIKPDDKTDKLNHAARLVRALRDQAPGENLDGAVFNIGDAALLKERFENYNNFCKDVRSPVSETADGLWLARIEIGGGRNVQLIGLNTALLCNDDNDKEKLNIPHATSTAAFFKIQRDDLVFVLTHHPIDWLNPRDVAHLSEKIGADAHVHLHGHMHTAGSQRIRSGKGESLVTVAAGAVHADESEHKVGIPHTFSYGAVVELDDGSIAVRIWPRRWAAGAWLPDYLQLPEGLPYAEHVLVPSLDVKSVTQPTNPVERFAQTAVSEMGRRRTAFPLDMSVEELRADGLVIPTRFGPRGAKDASELLSISDVIADYSDKSLLILGAPGSGKTVILYEISKGLLEQTKRFPILLDITKLRDSKVTWSNVVRAAEIDSSITKEVVKSSGVFIIDSLDEALSAGMTATATAACLKGLAKLGKIVVSCREDDFVYGLSARTPYDIFDKIWYVRDWDFEQFEDLVARLDKKGRLFDQSLIQLIQGDTSLQKFTRRPLLARMLTFLGNEHAFPKDKTSLYSEYMNQLGKAIDVRVGAVGCIDMVNSVDLWQKLSWYIFDSQLQPDSIQEDTIKMLARDVSATEDCTRRALVGILDMKGGLASYFHYSFYEFLTAQFISLNLQRNLELDPDSCVNLFKRDLTPELRHHLVGLLTRSGLDLAEWPRRLAEIYKGAETTSLSDSLIVKNLLVYLASRIDVAADEPLLELLQQEKDLFLRNSLFWALAERNNLETLPMYLNELTSNRQLASFNRGYSLYYYEDLTSPKGPPHADDEPYGAWSRTREALNQRYNAEAYKSVAEARKVIDMYTFCDIARVRNEALTAEEIDHFRRLIGSLEASTLPPEVLELLSDLLEAATADNLH